MDIFGSSERDYIIDEIEVVGGDVEQLENNFTNHENTASIHYIESSISHLNIGDIGTASHSDIDTFITTDQSRFDTKFSAKTTTDLTEGTNLYYSEARVSSNLDVAANTAHRGTDALHRVIDDITPSAITLYSGTKIESLVSNTASSNQLIDTNNPSITLRDSDGANGTSTGNLVFINGDDEKEVSSLRVNNLDTTLRNTQTNGQIILDNGVDHKITMNANSTTTLNHPINTGNLSIDQSTAPVLNLTDNDAILGDGSDISATINFNDSTAPPANNFGKVQYTGGNLDINNFSATGKIGLSSASGNSNIQIDQTVGQVDINAGNTDLSGNLTVLNGDVDITGATNNLNVYSTVAVGAVSVNNHIDDVGIHRRVVDAPNGSATQLWSSLYTKERIDAIPRGLSFQSLWNASSGGAGGIPNILAGTKLNGYYWITSVAGSKDLNGTGAITYNVGDWIIYSDNGVDPPEYQKLDTTDNINDAGPPSSVELYSSQKIEDRLNDNIVINDVSPSIKLEDANAIAKLGVRTEIQMNTNNSTDTASRVAQTVNGLELINDSPNIETSKLSLSGDLRYTQMGTPSFRIINSLAATPAATSGFLIFADQNGTAASRIVNTGGSVSIDALGSGNTLTLSAFTTNMVMSSGTNRTLFNHAIESTVDLTLPNGSVNDHIGDDTKHFLIDDGSIGTDIVWSASKLDSTFETKTNVNNHINDSSVHYILGKSPSFNAIKRSPTQGSPLPFTSLIRSANFSVADRATGKGYKLEMFGFITATTTETVEIEVRMNTNLMYSTGTFNLTNNQQFNLKYTFGFGSTTGLGSYSSWGDFQYGPSGNTTYVSKIARPSFGGVALDNSLAETLNVNVIFHTDGSGLTTRPEFNTRGIVITRLS